MIERMQNEWKLGEQTALLENFKKTGRYCDVRNIDLPGRSYAAKYQRLYQLINGKKKSTLNRKLLKIDAGYKPMNYWTPQEDAKLMAQYNADIPFADMRLKGRTRAACEYRVKKLLAAGTRNRPWTEADMEELRRQYLAGVYISRIRIEGRTSDAIRKRVERMREAGAL